MPVTTKGGQPMSGSSEEDSEEKHESEKQMTAPLRTGAVRGVDRRVGRPVEALFP